MHPSKWRETPAEAAWDYSVGVRNGGWGYRQRTVRWADPVVTDVLEGREGGEEEEEDGEMVGEVAESDEEDEDKEAEEEWVLMGRWSSNWGVVGENPDEEMQDVFEEIDPSLYLGTGVLEDADTPRRQ